MLGDTSRVQLSYIPEATFGVTPGSGTPKNLRITGESLTFALSKEKSKEIRADRQDSDLIVVGASASGGVNIEPSYNEYDDFLEALLQGTWSAYGVAGVGATFSATFASSTITAAVAPTGASAFTTLTPGQWIKVNAPSNVNDGLFVKLHAATAPTSTVITLDAATPLAAGGPIAGSSIATSRLTEGVTQRSFTIQRAHTDINQFFAFRGMTAQKGTMSLTNGALVTGTVEFMGKDAVRSASTLMPGAGAASHAYSIMNAVTGVGAILEGGSQITGTFVKSLTWDYDNKLRGRGALGILGNASIGAGTIELKGTLDVYLADGTLYDKFLNNTSTSLQVSIRDNANNGYVLTFPRVKYNDARVNAGGRDADAMLSLPWEALQDPVTGHTMIIDRVGVAVT